MGLKTFTIELRVDFDSEEKNEIILRAARTAAKHIYTTATLISDKRKPQVALSTSDLFEGSAEISLADDLDIMVDEVEHEQ